MRVLQLSKYYYPIPGGIETVVYDLTEGLNEAGIKCDVLSFNNAAMTVVEDYHNYKVFRAALSKEVFSTPLSLKYYRLLKELVPHYDIIHIHLPNPLATVFALFCNIRAKKIVIHWHSDIVKQKIIKLFYKPFQNMILRRADAIVPTTTIYAEGSVDLQKFMHKVRPIPIGISDTLGIDQTLLERLKEKYKNRKIVFSLGRHVYYKGFEYLIESAKYLNESNITILIGGNGPLTAKYQELIAQYGVQGIVELVGKIPQEQLGAYYALADVFCLPSTHKAEAYGVVLLEALMFGVPLITTDILNSGVKWVNHVSKAGLEAPVGDSQALAESIKRIFGNSKYYEMLSDNARRYFLEHFTSAKMVAAFLDLYKSL